MNPSVNKPTALLILGMHRSGTSALAGMLHYAGINLGHRLTPGRTDNPKGFYEHDDIWRIHDRLLNQLGSSWLDIRVLPDGWLSSKSALEALEELKTVIHRDFLGNMLWAVKEPRMARLCPLWLRLLDSINTDACAILALRNPLEVAYSLMKRNGLDMQHALALWLRYTIDVEFFSRKLKRLPVHYPDLLTNWSGQLDKIQMSLELELGWQKTGRMRDIQNFLDPELRHHHNKQDMRSLPQPWAGWCESAYSAMQRLSEESAIVTLENIRLELEAFEQQAAPYAASYAEQISNHLRQCMDMGAQIQRLENEQLNLINHIHSMERSKSWKLTAPLRTIDLALKKSVRLF